MQLRQQGLRAHSVVHSQLQQRQPGGLERPSAIHLAAAILNHKSSFQAMITHHCILMTAVNPRWLHVLKLAFMVDRTLDEGG